MEKYSEEIMEAVRENIGLEAYDESRDGTIMRMGKEEILDRVLEWNGLIGYGDTVKSWIENIYGIKLN
jgi:hypothetical protein